MTIETIVLHRQYAGKRFSNPPSRPSPYGLFGPDMNGPGLSNLPDAREHIMNGRCPICEKPVDFARIAADPFMREEYNISGPCPSCIVDMHGEQYKRYKQAKQVHSSAVATADAE